MDDVLSFSDLHMEKRPFAGGKGGTLARLYQAGYPVPAGFVILSSAFAGDQLRPEAWKLAQMQLNLLRHGRKAFAFAVRSSALSEDSAQASFAGEFETILNVGTVAEIREAIHQVRRSRHSHRVTTYSQAQGMDAIHEIAVVVQCMIQPDISGILFTADPVTGSLTRMSGSFVDGLGERLVSGEATGKSFSLERPNGRYDGPPELKRYGRQLFKLAGRLEKDLGCPQDMEWAIANGKLYLLQSRPITTLRGYNPTTGEWNDSLTGDYLWSNVNFGEAVPNVMTPLTWSVLRFILDDWLNLAGHHPVGNIGGRPYLNISLFISAFQAIGKGREEFLESMAGTLYMRLPEEMSIPLVPLPRWPLFTALPPLMRLQMKQRQGVRKLPAWLAANPARFREMRQAIREANTRADLLALWHERICPHVTQNIWPVLGSVTDYSDYTAVLRQQLIELVGPKESDVLISNLGASSEKERSAGLLPSLGPVVGIARVARGEMDRAAYLEQYGHRGPDEFELSTPRPAEDPEWLDQQLARFKSAPSDVDALISEQQAKSNAAWERFRSRYPRQAKSMRRRLDEVGRRGYLREMARSEYTRDRWLVRLFALRAGELTGLGNDIFFLTLDELLDHLAGKEIPAGQIPIRQGAYHQYKTLPPYPSLIRGRFQPGEWAADPQRRSDYFDAQMPLTAVTLENGRTDVILGAPGSAGRVEGMVRRLDSAEDGDQLQAGEILVAAQTDIAWTLLFPRAAAIVTDVGAPLSHAAIVARELGIPAVVGCGDATMRLKTGDRVRVDGGQGTVEVFEVE